jgi:hypothetical protein
LKEKLKQIATLFSQYNIYPREKFIENTPARLFQSYFPDDYYNKDLNFLLSYQGTTATQRGADLPWWGSKYFSNDAGYRTMVIAQDSLSPDAGSIVFYTSWMDKMDVNDFSAFRKAHHLPRFNSYSLARDLLKKLCDFDYSYITDASKVYMSGSWNDHDFDLLKSKTLLFEEIEICNPDIVILLGKDPMKLMDFKEKYIEVVGKKCLIKNDKKYVIAPFPSLTFKNSSKNLYEERELNTIDLLRVVRRSV